MMSYATDHAVTPTQPLQRQTELLFLRWKTTEYKGPIRSSSKTLVTPLRNVQ